MIGSTVALQINAADTRGAPVTFSAAGLPPGTSISAAGLITGKPTATGTYPVTVRVHDGQGRRGSVFFTWRVTS